jgi:hypothetical protein
MRSQEILEGVTGGQPAQTARSSQELARNHEGDGWSAEALWWEVSWGWLTPLGVLSCIVAVDLPWVSALVLGLVLEQCRRCW